MINQKHTQPQHSKPGELAAKNPDVGQTGHREQKTQIKLEKGKQEITGKKNKKQMLCIPQGAAYRGQDIVWRKTKQ